MRLITGEPRLNLVFRIKTKDELEKFDREAVLSGLVDNDASIQLRARGKLLIKNSRGLVDNKLPSSADIERVKKLNRDGSDLNTAEVSACLYDYKFIRSPHAQASPLRPLRPKPLFDASKRDFDTSYTIPKIFTAESAWMERERVEMSSPKVNR